MKLQIDNLDGQGPRDYTAAIDAANPPLVVRKLNKPAELRVSLVANDPSFIVPATGSRITVGRTNGQDVFTGYLSQAPVFEYLGWGATGPVYRYDLIAYSDEILLDQKRLPDRSPFVDRSAGNALRQMTQDLLPGILDTSAVQDLDFLPSYYADPQKTWSQHVAEIAILARASYRVLNSSVIFEPIGSKTLAVSEGDPNFNPGGLALQPVNALINDVTVIGEVEPQAYVKDYFIGDGLTSRFYLSQTPFTKSNTTVFDEEYSAAPLDPSLWNVIDPASAISVANGKLQIAGGTGADGITVVEYVEQLELGGALLLQHGDVTFSARSRGVLGGIYNGPVAITNCTAGFQITPNGAQSSIQALVNGEVSGPVITTTAGHHYVFTTRLYSDDIYRTQQGFHSSLHPAENEIGGSPISADVRMVLEVQDIDPANSASEVAPATVLYDGQIANAPSFCNYVLVNAADLQCAIAFTRLIRAIDAQVRTALNGQSYITRLVGPLDQGSECNLTSSSELKFYSASIPAANQAISVHYRGSRRALARITNPASIAAQQRGVDNGLHGSVRHLKLPLARTSSDCENAALAILDDSTAPAWKGCYQTWSDFLPGNAADIFPGDALALSIPSRSACFQAIVREVEITMRDLQAEYCVYQIKFSNDAAGPLAFEFQASPLKSLPDITELANSQVGSTYLDALTGSEITLVSSTTLNVDAGCTPLSGGGIEARSSDTGWGPGNDRNLIGRFTTQTFTVPRLAQIQDCYLRQYDSSSPPKYSRYTTALHVDYPL